MEKIELDIKQVEINWLIDNLERIKLVLEANYYTDKDKLIVIAWLAKQALKTKKED